MACTIYSSIEMHTIDIIFTSRICLLFALLININHNHGSHSRVLCVPLRLLCHLYPSDVIMSIEWKCNIFASWQFNRIFRGGGKKIARARSSRWWTGSALNTIELKLAIKQKQRHFDRRSSETIVNCFSDARQRNGLSLVWVQRAWLTSRKTSFGDSVNE